jgi:radical SAM family uncharacterized protein/radical SAM-linked protein
VEQPSRYLGNEVNSIHKDPRAVQLRMALAFPDLYEIGTSHFGIQILYTILNREPDIAAERVFAPGRDLEAQLHRTQRPLVSLETQTPLNLFDIIGFSLLYELNFTNMLTILELAGIPMYAARREPSHPFVIAGGPCTVNPEPVADFFDALVVGDGEEVVLEMTRAWLTWRKEGTLEKEALLKAWSHIEGVYIPSFFTVRYDAGSRQHLEPRFEHHVKVVRRIVGSLDRTVFPVEPVIPYGRPVHDRLRLEVARGCTRGCRFCQAGMIYRPVRERDLTTLLRLAGQSLDATGYEDLSLLSLSTGDYGCIVALLDKLMAQNADKYVAVSLPSLRAGTLSPTLMQLIKKVRKTGFTIAPEAGSQRLRNVINKNISEQEIVQTVSDAFAMGWQLVKLYFMIGLPTEEDDDLDAIVSLVQRLRQIKNDRGRRGKLNVSVATFIPKPHTPFQWAAQISLSAAQRKIEWLKQQLDLPGVKFKWQQPEVSLLEGLWARGDRRLSRLLVKAHRLGCRFDGWSDQFDFDAWQEALAAEPVKWHEYLTRARDLAEPLPWDHVDIRVDRDFLKQEWRRAQQGTGTDDCRTADCNACGVCDFRRIAPQTCQSAAIEPTPERPQQTPKEGRFKKLTLTYRKEGPARFLGHLEMVHVFIRALRRAKIDVKYSEGFHPMPRVSFEDPLPIGMESQQERLYLTVPEGLVLQDIGRRLNRQLPPGLAVTACEEGLARPTAANPEDVCYRIRLTDGVFDQRKLQAYVALSEFNLVRRSRKGRITTIDLKKAVPVLSLQSPRILEMTTRPEPGKMVRPFEVAAAVFELPESVLKQARIVKHPCVSAFSAEQPTCVGDNRVRDTERDTENAEGP